MRSGCQLIWRDAGPCAFEIVEIFLDLRLSLSLRGLVYGKLDGSGGVPHYLGAESRVFGADVLIVEAN